MADPLPIRREEVLIEIEREIALRRRVYPRWVDQGKLKLDRAERQIALMEEAVRLLRVDGGRG